jgi:hypothetical protein
MPINFIVISVIACAVPFVALSIAYLIWLRPSARLHFGEEFSARRDHAAAKRRKSFERSCINAMSFVFFAMTAWLARCIIAVAFDNLATEISWIAAGAIALLLLIAAGFAWAASNRWREPYSD